MCARCFHATDHTDHNITFYIAQQSGGCCDCGDLEAWRRPVACRYHPPLPDRGISQSQSTPRAVPQSISTKYISPVSPNRATLPPELWDSMSRTVAYALDFILDTLDFSPDETVAPTSEEAMRSQPTADPLVKDLFCVVAWNDERHSFDEIIRHITANLGRSHDEAVAYAGRIDDQGRDVVEMSSYTPRLLDVASSLAKIDLGVTVRRAYDTFREQIATILIEWLLDLTRSRLEGDNFILREVVASELLSPRRKDSSSIISNQENAKIVAELKDPSRLDWLFLYHTRLWKKPRLNLKELYVSILTLSHEYKMAVGMFYSNRS